MQRNKTIAMMYRLFGCDSIFRWIRILFKTVRLIEIYIIRNFTKNLIAIFALSDAAKQDDCNDVSLIWMRFDFQVDPNFVQNCQAYRNLYNSKFYKKFNRNFCTQRCSETRRLQ